jgi:hypothetical protein
MGRLRLAFSLPAGLKSPLLFNIGFVVSWGIIRGTVSPLPVFVYTEWLYRQKPPYRFLGISFHLNIGNPNFDIPVFDLFHSA